MLNEWHTVKTMIITFREQFILELRCLLSGMSVRIARVNAVTHLP